MAERRSKQDRKDDGLDGYPVASSLTLPIKLAMAGVSLAASFLAAVSFDREVAMMIASFGIEQHSARIIAYGLIVVPVTLAVFAALQLLGSSDHD